MYSVLHWQQTEPRCSPPIFHSQLYTPLTELHRTALVIRCIYSQCLVIDSPFAVKRRDVQTCNYDKFSPGGCLLEILDLYRMDEVTTQVTFHGNGTDWRKYADHGGTYYDIFVVAPSQDPQLGIPLHTWDTFRKILGCLPVLPIAWTLCAREIAPLERGVQAGMYLEGFALPLRTVKPISPSTAHCTHVYRMGSP